MSVLGLSSENKKRYIPSLNGIRAVSIIMVIIGHIAPWQLNLNESKYWFLCNGLLGVHFFFVVSGFLITTLLIEEEIEKGSISLKNFYLRRIFRIFPAYYFLLFCYFILQCFHLLKLTPVSWITALTYTKSFFDEGKDRLSGHLWSLSIEEFFYLFWPLVFFYMKNYRKIIVWLVVILLPILRLWYSIKIGPVLNIGFFKSIDVLMLGCLFALYKEPIYKYIDKFISRMNIVVYVPIILLFFLRYVDELDIGTIRISGLFLLRKAPIMFHIDLSTVFGINSTIGSVLIAITVIMSIRGTKSFLYNFLNSNIMWYIGILSYSLYLWQELFIVGKLGILTTVPYNIAFMLVAAILTYNFIEKPMLRIRSKFLRI